MSKISEKVFLRKENECFMKAVGLESNGFLSMDKVCAVYPFTTSLRYLDSHDVWRNVVCFDNYFYPPPDGWQNKTFVCVNVNEIIPGEEKWDTLKNWDELDHNDKIFVVIERSKPTLLAFSTSVNLADFSPWELNSNFEKLYGSGSSVYNRNPLEKLVERMKNEKGSTTKRKQDRGKSKERRIERSRQSQSAGRAGTKSRGRIKDKAPERDRSRSREEPSSCDKVDSDNGMSSSSDEIQVVSEYKVEQSNSVRSRLGHTAGSFHKSPSRDDRFDRRRSSRSRSRSRRRDCSIEDSFQYYHRPGPPRESYDHNILERKQRELSAERRRTQDERLRNYEERRKIRQERRIIEDRIRANTRKSQWMQKSDDFLRRLGIGESTNDPYVIMDRNADRNDERLRELNCLSDNGVDFRHCRQNTLRDDRTYRRSLERRDNNERELWRNAHDAVSHYSNTKDTFSPRAASIEQELDIVEENIFGRRLPSDIDRGRRSDFSDTRRLASPINHNRQSMDADVCFGRQPQPPPAAEPELLSCSTLNPSSGFNTEQVFPSCSNTVSPGLQRQTPTVNLIDMDRILVDDDREYLKPGNYTMVMLDMIMLGRGIRREVYQIGAYSSLSDSFLRCIQPVKNYEEAVLLEEMPLVDFKNGKHLFNKLDNKMLNTYSVDDAFEHLLTYLSKVRTLTRPAFEGVVLVCPTESMLTYLLKSLRQMGLEKAFWNIVISVGDLNTYISSMCKTSQQLQKSLMDNMNVNCRSLDEVYYNLFHTKIEYKAAFSDLRANWAFQIFLKINESPPTYNNYFKGSTFVKESRTVKTILKPRNFLERMENFVPLKVFITQTLEAQREDLQEEDEVESLPTPHDTAMSMCKSLIGAGFDFEELMKMGKVRGLEEMELNMRTILLKTIAGQSKAIIDNAIHTTKLVVKFFLQNGHKSFEELLFESRVYAFDVLAEAENADCNKPSVSVAYDQLEAYLCDKIASCVLPSTAHRKLPRGENCIRALKAAGLTVDALHSLYNLHAQHEAGFHSELSSKLYSLYEVYEPNLRFKIFVQYLTDFLSQNRTGGAQSDDYHINGGNNVPSWYLCRACMASGHWLDDCPRSRRQQTVSDKEYLDKYLETNKLATKTGNWAANMKTLEQCELYISRSLSKTCQVGTKALEAFCNMVAKAVVKGLAISNVQGKNLHHCKGLNMQQVVEKLKIPHSKTSLKFPHLVDMNYVLDVIMKYIEILN